MAKQGGQPLNDVIRRELLDSPHAEVAIRDHLSCGHSVTKRVSNSGNYHDYNPAKRRRCDECPPLA